MTSKLLLKAQDNKEALKKGNGSNSPRKHLGEQQVKQINCHNQIKNLKTETKNLKTIKKVLALNS